MTKLIPTVNFKPVVAATAFLTLFSLIVPDVAEARRFGGSRFGQRNVNNAPVFETYIDFEFDLDPSDELTPGLYPDAVFNYRHDYVINDNDPDPDIDDGSFDFFSSGRDETYDLLIQECCGTENIGTTELSLISTDIANLIPEIITDGSTSQNPDDFLQYTVLIEPENAPDSRGVFSFLISKDSGLTAIADTSTGVEESIYIYEGTAFDGLPLSGDLDGEILTSDAEPPTRTTTTPESNNVFGLVALGIIGLGFISKKKATHNQSRLPSLEPLK